MESCMGAAVCALRRQHIPLEQQHYFDASWPGWSAVSQSCCSLAPCWSVSPTVHIEGWCGHCPSYSCCGRGQEPVMFSHTLLGSMWHTSNAPIMCFTRFEPCYTEGAWPKGVIKVVLGKGLSWQLRQNQSQQNTFLHMGC